MARIENTNLPLAAKGTNSVGISLIRVLLCFLQGQKLFIHIVPGNIVDFWNSDFLKETQTFWKKLRLSEKVAIGPFFCMNFFSLPSSSHEFFFFAFSLAWIFFVFSPPPPPPITFQWSVPRKAWYSGYRSERNWCNCVKKPGKKKKSGLQRDLNPWPRGYRCDALPVLWSYWSWEQVNCLFIRSRERNEC